MGSETFNLQQYNENALLYIDSNLNGEIGGKNPQARALILKEHCPAGASIFEIGSGSGMDAEVLMQAGFEVHTSDFSQAFISILQSKGFEATHFDVLKDTPSKDFDCIYANAVFVHIGRDDFVAFLKRCKSTLAPKTIFFATFLKGTGSERSSRGRGFERDFFYYSESDIQKIIEEADMHTESIELINDKWISLVASF